MRIDVYHHFPEGLRFDVTAHDDPRMAEVLERLGSIERKVGKVLANQVKEEQTMSRVSDELADAVVLIEEQATVQAGVSTLIGEVSSKIDDLLAQLADATTAGDEEKAQAILAELRTRNQALKDSRDALAAAVAKGTVADPAPPAQNPEPVPGEGQGGEPNPGEAQPLPDVSPGSSGAGEDGEGEG